MEIKSWNSSLPTQLEPDIYISSILKRKTGEDLIRFIAKTQNGEILIAFDKDESIRISMQRANGSYCLFQLPFEKVADFFRSDKHKLTDLRDALYEDPIVSGLTRAEAIDLLGINEAI